MSYIFLSYPGVSCHALPFPLRVMRMFAFVAAALLLVYIAPRIDRLNSANSGAEEMEMIEPVKPPVAGNVVEDEGRSRQVTSRHHTTPS